MGKYKYICGHGKNAAYKGIRGHKVYIDWNKAHIPPPSGLNSSTARAQMEYWDKKFKEDPYYKIYGRVRTYQTWEELFTKVEEYFESCNGIIYGKFGPLYDANGEPLIGQVRAYSIPGLCLYLGISRKTFYNYMRGGRDGIYPIEFALVCEYAMQRVEDYYAQQLMTKDGQRGAQFALQCAYGWRTPKEKAEIKKLRSEIKIAEQDMELKKRMQEAKLKLIEDAGDDDKIEIRIVRAEE